MPWPQYTIAENLRGWRGVVKTCDEELKKGTDTDKERWLKARVEAQGMVLKLEEVVKMEKAASKTFFAAQKKLAMLKLVSNGD